LTKLSAYTKLCHLLAHSVEATRGLKRPSTMVLTPGEHNEVLKFTVGLLLQHEDLARVEPTLSHINPPIEQKISK